MSAINVRVRANGETFVSATMCPRLPGPLKIYGCMLKFSAKGKGLVNQVIFFSNLSRNIVVLLFETLCCAYYYVCDQLVSHQNTVLQVCGIYTYNLSIVCNFKMATSFI